MTQLEFVILFLILTAGFTISVWRIVLRFLQFYQQEEYTARRFFHWWIQTRSFEKRATVMVCIVGIIFFLYEILLTRSVDYSFLTYVYIACYLFVLPLCGWSNKNYIDKKSLVMTGRAIRIFSLTIVFLATAFSLGMLMLLFELLVIGFVVLSIGFFYTAILILLIPLFIVIANQCLSPVESFIQRRFLNEARSILAQYKPTLIGITGSYGKTSTKHILNHLLNAHAPSLATPGSVNTLMGITRIIRERLKREHRYFIVEMGAYGVGSIKKLCGLTPPDTALVTSVGIAHLERFKNIETVAKAKSELPQALPEKGLAVLNGDDPRVRAMANSTQAEACFFGRSEDTGTLDCRLVSEAITENGTRMTLEYDGKPYTVDLPLYGAHQALNATAAFLTSVRLGVPAITAAAALRTVPPIAHRFVVHRGADGITTIDDAYNSNPIGFKNALDVMDVLNGTQKILVTPGMVELGDRADEEHTRIAVQAAKVCTHICLIAPHRIQTFRSVLLENGFPSDNLHEFDSLNEAQNWLKDNLNQGAIVLLENDLPDLYESVSAFKFFG